MILELFALTVENMAKWALITVVAYTEVHKAVAQFKSQ
jgi:hypothetical protein